MLLAANELSTNASYVRESTEDQALVYPGLFIQTIRYRRSYRTT